MSTQDLQAAINAELYTVGVIACINSGKGRSRVIIDMANQSRNFFQVSPYVDGGHGAPDVDYVSTPLRSISERLDTSRMFVDLVVTLDAHINGVNYLAQDYTLTAKYVGDKVTVAYRVSSSLTPIAREQVCVVLRAIWQALNVARPSLRHEMALIAVDNVRTKVSEIERWTRQMFVAMDRQDRANPVSVAL